MTKNEIANSFPTNIYHRIPNFKGAADAAQRLAELDEFKKARTIKINPDKPQEPVRFLALEANKEIIVPIPRLRSGLFRHVTPVAGATKGQLKTLASMRGMEQYGKPLGLESNIKVKYSCDKNLITRCLIVEKCHLEYLTVDYFFRWILLYWDLCASVGTDIGSVKAKASRISSLQ